MKKDDRVFDENGLDQNGLDKNGELPTDKVEEAMHEDQHKAEEDMKELRREFKEKHGRVFIVFYCLVH